MWCAPLIISAKDGPPHTYYNFSRLLRRNVPGRKMIRKPTLGGNIAPERTQSPEHTQRKNIITSKKAGYNAKILVPHTDIFLPHRLFFISPIPPDNNNKNPLIPIIKKRMKNIVCGEGFNLSSTVVWSVQRNRSVNTAIKKLEIPANML